MKFVRKLADRPALLIALSATLVAARHCSSAIILTTVPVGNPGNTPDLNTGNGIYYGQVNYAYSICKYDVTADQYAAFLNSVAATGDPHGLYAAAMSGTSLGYPGITQSNSSGTYTYSVATGRGNNPVSDVTFWDAARFANWVANGQPTGPEGVGTTETGSYTLSAGGTTVTRNSNAAWAVTSEAEWYKAAYYTTSKDGGAAGYYPYPTGDEIDEYKANFGVPMIPANAPANTGNDTTRVGSFSQDPSPYGTNDQAGDVFQWTEPAPGNGYADVRGGAFNSGGDYGVTHSTEFYTEALSWDSQNTGFRLSQPGISPAVIDVGKSSAVIISGAASITTVMSELNTGYNNGHWNGAFGIISSAASTDASHLTAVGAIINDTGANTGTTTGKEIFTSIDGSPTADGDVLLKFTYYGDANLTGKVDGSDYSLIDNGFLRHLTGWYNGDFNYDGIVNGSDYTLIDNSFNTQGVNLASDIASPTVEIEPQIAGSTTVPEPIGVLSLLLPISILAHRQRPSNRGTESMSQ